MRGECHMPTSTYIHSTYGRWIGRQVLSMSQCGSVVCIVNTIKWSTFDVTFRSSPITITIVLSHKFLFASVTCSCYKLIQMSLNLIFTVVASILSDLSCAVCVCARSAFTYCVHFMSFSSHIPKVFAIDLGIRRWQRRVNGTFGFSQQLWKGDRISSRTIDLFSVDCRRPSHCIAYNTQLCASHGHGGVQCACHATSVRRIYLVNTFDCLRSVQWKWIVFVATALLSATCSLFTVHCRLLRFSRFDCIASHGAYGAATAERLSHFRALRSRMADCMCSIKEITFFHLISRRPKQFRATKIFPERLAISSLPSASTQIRWMRQHTQHTRLLLHLHLAAAKEKNQTFRSNTFGWCKRAKS